jgi:hypothetical protein
MRDDTAIALLQPAAHIGRHDAAADPARPAGIRGEFPPVRLALRDGAIDPASFTSVRLVSGAGMLVVMTMAGRARKAGRRGRRGRRRGIRRRCCLCMRLRSAWHT